MSQINSGVCLIKSRKFKEGMELLLQLFMAVNQRGTDKNKFINPVYSSSSSLTSEVLSSDSDGMDEVTLKKWRQSFTKTLKNHFPLTLGFNIAASALLCGEYTVSFDHASELIHQLS